MVNDAQRLPHTDVVDQLHYLVFAENRENAGDDVEEYLRAERPDLIGDDHFADGVLIIGVGLDPRQAFVYGGEDVFDALHLRRDTALRRAVDAIKPGVENHNIPAGLYAGADATLDVEQTMQALYEKDEQAHTTNKTLAATFGGLGAGGVVFGMGEWRRHRHRKTMRARKNLDVVNREYGDIAQRLDAINVRAHSLTSPIANQELRAQWEQVRDDFLNLHEAKAQLGSLDVNSPDAEFLTHSDALIEAAKTTRRVSNAEKNIEQLYRLENGDAAVRSEELRELRADALEAQVQLKKKDTPLYSGLETIKNRAEDLMTKVTDPTFVDAYVVLLDDYHTVLEEYRRQQFSDADETELEAPKVYQRSYRPGYGYNGYVPFTVMNTWHTNHQNSQQASSNGVRTGFSSGFSGSGGTSRF